MNKVYSKVWNAALGQLVVASELAGMRGQRADGARQPRRSAHALKVLVLAIGMTFASSALAQSWNVQVNNDAATEVAPGDTLTLQQGQNILISRSGNVITIKTVNTPSFQGADMGGARITHVGNGTSATDAVNKSQLDAVSTVANNANQGWKLQANGDTASQVAPGQTVQFKDDGKNVVITRSGNNITVSLKNTPSFVGADMGGARITHVGNGTSATDAVNKSQLDAVSAVANNANQGWNVQTNGGAAQNLGPGDTLNLKQGQNILISRSGNDITVKTVATPTFQGAAMGGKKITGVAAGTAATDAVNKAQLDAVSATANAGWNISAQGANATNVASGDAVDLANSDGNIKVSKTATDNDVNFDLADNISVTSVAAGNSTVDNDGLTIAGGPQFTSNGIDAGNQSITGVADGAVASGSKDAVNGGQLYDLKNSLNVVGAGVKYFHANSILADSQATGVDSIAIGPETVAGGDDGLAAGHGANIDVQSINGIALGKDAAIGLQSNSAVAIGDTASVGKTADNAVVIGTQASADESSSDAVSVGHSANADQNAVAIGHAAQASGSAVGLGLNASAGGGASVAIGSGAQSAMSRDVAIGEGAGAGSSGSAINTVNTDNVYVGTSAGAGVAEGGHNVAMGFQSGKDRGSDSDENVAIGAQAGLNQSGRGNIAIGTEAAKQAVGSGRTNETVALGYQSSVTSDYGVVVGPEAAADGRNASAFGYNSMATGGGSLALGSNSKSLAGGFVALGNGSTADPTVNNPTTAAFLTGQTASYIVSIGGGSGNILRRITNVAGGAAPTDAVNVAQLQQLGTEMQGLFGADVSIDANGHMTFSRDGKGSLSSWLDAHTPGSGSGGTGTNPVVYDGAAATSISLAGAGGTQIHNLADGSSPTDAVNKRQLDSAIDLNKTHYFSVNSTGANNRDNDGATGANAMAIGLSSEAQGEGALAVGSGTKAGDDPTDLGAIALGGSADVRSAYGLAVGVEARTTDTNGTAIGHSARSDGTSSIALGHDAKVEKQSGTQNPADGIAIGHLSHVTRAQGTAIGNEAHAYAVKGQAFGDHAAALAGSAVAIGASAVSDAANAYAVGAAANAHGADSQAFGSAAITHTTNSIAFGTGAVAGDANIPVGSSSSDSIAMGDGAQVIGDHSIAVGSANTIGSHQPAPGGGSGTELAGNYSAAFGNGNTIQQDNTFVVGNNVITTQANSVVLGNASTDRSATTETGAPLYGVNRTFAGPGSAAKGVVSVGATGQERQIINVAAGNISATSTDAVNGSQLYQTNQALDGFADDMAKYLGGGSSHSAGGKVTQPTYNVLGTDYHNVGDAIAAATTHYYSVNDGGTQGGNYNNDGATGINALAAGVDATASGAGGIAIGKGANAQDTAGIAMGAGTTTGAIGQNVAIGSSGTTASTTDSLSGAVAIGRQQIANGGGAVAIGSSNTATGQGSVAIGRASDAKVAGAVAIGDSVTADGRRAIALGATADAVGDSAIAMGNGANGSANYAIAVGRLANATQYSAIAIGAGSKASGNSALALGKSSVANNANDVALGTKSTTAAVVNTTGATVDKVAYTYAGTAATSTVSIGTAGAERTLTNVAAGRVSATSTDAINGSQLFATDKAVDALGGDLDTLGTTTASSLGGTSAYDPATHTLTAGLDVGGTTYTSVQDALNQVNTTANAGWNVSAAGGTASNVKPGDTVDLSSADSNITVSQTDNGTEHDLAIALAKNLDLGTTGSITTGNTVINNAGVTINGGTNPVSLSNTGLDNGGNVITNVQSGGTTATNAANIGDVQKAAAAATTEVAAGTNVSVATDTTAADGHTTYTVNADGASVSAGSGAVSVTKGTKDANNVTDYAVDLSAATKTTLANAVQYDDGTHTSVTLGNAGTPVTVSNVADGDVSSTSTDAVNGSQLYTTNQNVATNTTDIGDLQTTVAKPITFSGNDNTAGPVTAKLGDTVAITGAATTAGTYTGANLKTVTDAATGAMSIQMAATPFFQGADMGGKKITHVADGTDPTDAVNKSQLDAVASTAGKGWNVSAAGGTVSNVKPGDTVDLSSADSNITVSQTDNGTEHDLAIALAKNLDLGTTGSITTGNTVINNAGVTINGGTNPVSLSNTGLDNGGNVITNVQSGGTTATNAANIGDVQKAAAAATTEVAAGTNVSVATDTTAADGHTTYTVNADGASVSAGSGAVSVTKGTKDANNVTDYAVDLSAATKTTLANAVQYDDGTHTSVTLGNAGTPVTVSNVADGDVSSTSTDAVNGSQLYDVQQAANAGWNVADANGNSNNIGPNGKVTFDGDSNITVTESGVDDDGKVTVALNKSLDLGATGSVTIGNSVFDTNGLAVDDGTHSTSYGADGLTIVNGPSVTSSGIDAGNKKVTHVADGDVSSTSTDAVNGSQLNATNVIVAAQGNSMVTILGGNASYDPVTGTTTMSNIGGTGEDNINDAIQSANDAATAGWNVSVQGANSTNVGPNDSVDLNNSDGNIVVSKTATSNDVTFDLADDITVDSVSLGSMVKIDTSGLFIVNGPSITVNGIDAGGKKITNVAPGTNPTDAVNKSQLDAVSNDVQQLADNTVQYDDASKGKVTMGGTTSTDGGKTGGTTITNVHRGDVSAGSTDAVNGSQLYETNQNVADNSQTIKDMQKGQAGYFQVNDSSDKGKPKATGKDSSAGGAGAVASGDDSTALGSGATATGKNSVAVGAGSTAERDNAVSVGSADQPRQVTHVADGTEATDAVNVSQLNGAVTKAQGWAKNYTDKRFDTLNQNVNVLGHRVDAGVASAIAMAALPQAYSPDQSSAAVAVGQFHGETGIAIGLSTITDSGRYVFKLNASTNTQGDAGVGVGAAVVW